MSIGKNIKKLRESYNLSQEELGKIAGVSDKAVSTWENDTKTPRMGAIQKIADHFGIKKSDLIEDEQQSIFSHFDNISPIQTQRLPLLGEIACGEPIFCDEDRESYVEVGTNIRADFCLRAKGDSMINARICDGDIVFIRQQPMVENGDIAAVVIDNEATLKRVYFDKENGKLVLQAENPKYKPLMYVGEELNSIRILGKAIAFESNL